MNKLRKLWKLFSLHQRIRYAHHKLSQDIFQIRDDVRAAVANKLPVVALESTIITHGMPYPQNLQTALHVEKIIRDHGVVPATVGIINGKLIVGLNKNEITFLSQATSSFVKTSRRDLAYVLSKNLSGGTTVSATMIASQMAGIPIFVTGGIGGVHRGASESFDISADLTELGKTQVAVVCAGIKSILDIGLTLEYLETQGVPVITYSKTNWFPSFFTPRSKFKAPYCMETTEEIAQCIDQHLSLDLRNGMVIGVPVQNSLVGEEIEDAVQHALQITKENNVAGKDITPFVLDYISKTTKGKSLQANIKLIEHNAEVGAKIAKDLSKVQNKHGRTKSKKFTSIISNSKQVINKPRGKRPVIIGGSIFDIKATAQKIDSVAEATNAGKLSLSFGGVGRNVAECLARLDTNPLLISAVGNDYHGEMLLSNLEKINMDTAGILISHHHPTASYSVMAKNDGELLMTVGDMDVHESISYLHVLRHEEEIKNAAVVVLDGNIPEETLNCAIEMCRRHDVPVWFEPTGLEKASKPFHSLNNVTYASPNFVELKAIHSAITKSKNTQLEIKEDWEWYQIIEECSRYIGGCLKCIDNLVITLGKHGVLIVRKNHQELFPLRASSHSMSSDSMGPSVTHYKAVREDLLPVSVKSVSGAGDSFAGAMLYGIMQQYDADVCVKSGLLAAYMSLNTYTAISKEIRPEVFTVENITKWAPYNHVVI
ncbi:uncharacterized protein LOC130647488 [Hydractinia symbiolongicarpus]|uniref:uncharacterized protein LOC130647488 n=1 Tax=Hydractinia symbiolongicarpus TaxID=13093 RepID=UPI00254ED073|nr:uncharacterized protein LOC130647488 [Hydractinia symbiolongicarpus]